MLAHGKCPRLFIRGVLHKEAGRVLVVLEGLDGAILVELRMLFEAVGARHPRCNDILMQVRTDLLCQVRDVIFVGIQVRCIFKHVHVVLDSVGIVTVGTRVVSTHSRNLYLQMLHVQALLEHTTRARVLSQRRGLLSILLLRAGLRLGRYFHLADSHGRGRSWLGRSGSGDDFVFEGHLSLLLARHYRLLLYLLVHLLGARQAAACGPRRTCALTTCTARAHPALFAVRGQLRQVMVNPKRANAGELLLLRQKLHATFSRQRRHAHACNCDKCNKREHRHPVSLLP
mmetsp:Transcript_30320/g.48951  ORF Transcript_30320/g.48951 Transcript_30320/m.48951 type:complete len:286 (-) Transcript_30320:40-897(-)